MKRLYLIISAALLLIGVGQARAVETTISVSLDATNANATMIRIYGGVTYTFLPSASSYQYSQKVQTDQATLSISSNDMIWLKESGASSAYAFAWHNNKQGTLAISDAYSSYYYISSITMNCQAHSYAGTADRTVTIGSTSVTLSQTADDSGNYTAQTLEWTNSDEDVTTATIAIANGSIQVNSLTVVLTLSASKYASSIYESNGSTYYPVSDGATTQGYKTASDYNTALSALEAAIDNTESTDDELIAAADDLTVAAAAFAADTYVETPTDFTNKYVVVGSAAESISTGQWYLVYNNRSVGYTGSYWTDTTPKVAGGGIYMSNGTGVISSSITMATDAAPYLVRFIAVDADNGIYKFQFATGNYAGDVNGSTSESTAIATNIEGNAMPYHVYLPSGSTTGFAINDYSGSSDGSMVDNNGPGGTVVYYGSGTNSATSGNNIWTFYPVTLTSALDAYAAALSTYSSKVSTWASGTTSADALFYPNTTKVSEVQTLVNTTYASPSTEAEAIEWLAILAEKVNSNYVLNMPEADVAYSLNNYSYTSYYMGEGTSHSVNGIQTVATRSLWYFEKNADDDTYAIKNVLTGDYIPAVTRSTAATASTTTPNYFNIVYQNVPGVVLFGNEGFYTHLNLSTTGYVIVGWGTGAGASKWMGAAVTGDALTAAATAETTLAQSEVTDIVSNANSTIGTILGVTVSASDVTSLNDYIDGFDYKILYKKAEGNYYRFSGSTTDSYNGNTGQSISVGLNGTTIVPIHETTSTSDVNQLWQIEVAESGCFYIKSPNLVAAGQNAYIATPKSTSAAVTLFTDQENAQDFYIDVVSGTCFRLRPNSGAANSSINLESTTTYLNAWGGTYSYLNAAKVEAIDITLNQAGDSYYATAYMPFGVTPSGATAYTAGTVADGVMPLTEATSVAAGTAVVLIGSSSSATLTIGDVDGAASSSTLSGKYVDTTVDANSVLTLGAVNSVAGFYTYSGTTLSANKAYLEGTSSAVRFSLGFDDTTDGISAVDTESTTQNDAIYDMSGRRVQKAVKGLYIVNGKKVIK